MEVFCITSDGRLNCLKAFAHQFCKYWGADTQVIVCGYKAPAFALPSNFLFFSIGDMADYPVGKWSDALIRVLLHFPKSDLVTLFLEDYLIVEPVNRRIVSMAADYMRQYRNTLKFDLSADRRYAAGSTPYGDLGGIPLVKSDPNSQYHMSLWPGMFSRELLLKILVPGLDPWQVELFLTPRLAAYGDEIVVVGTDTGDNPWPIRISDVYRAGTPGELLLEGISDADVAELREKGLI